MIMEEQCSLPLTNEVEVIPDQAPQPNKIFE